MHAQVQKGKATKIDRCDTTLSDPALEVLGTRLYLMNVNDGFSKNVNVLCSSKRLSDCHSEQTLARTIELWRRNLSLDMFGLSDVAAELEPAGAAACRRNLLLCCA